MERSKEIKESLKNLQDDVNTLHNEVLACALEFPNMTHPDVPVSVINSSFILINFKKN